MLLIMYCLPRIFMSTRHEAISSSGANSFFSLITCCRSIVLRRFCIKDMLNLLLMLVLKVLWSLSHYHYWIQLLTSVHLHLGYNISIIAYGQTGSGKSYTVFGPGLLFAMNEADFGLVPRAVRHIFYKKKVKCLFSDYWQTSFVNTTNLNFKFKFPH